MTLDERIKLLEIAKNNPDFEVGTKTAAEFLETTENAVRIMVCRQQLGRRKNRSRLRFRVGDLLKMNKSS